MLYMSKDSTEKLQSSLEAQSTDPVKAYEELGDINKVTAWITECLSGSYGRWWIKWRWSLGNIFIQPFCQIS